MKTAAVILAAGAGVRLKSRIPKVLRKINGKPMISIVAKAACEVADKIIFVISNPAVEKAIADFPKSSSVWQKIPNGTAKALEAAYPELKNFRGEILVMPADMPAINGEILKNFLDFHRKNKNDISILSARVQNPRGYGRIIKKGEFVCEIVEELDATSRQKKIKTISSGVFIFPPKIFPLLKKIPLNLRKGEYYLTDVIKIASGLKMKIRDLPAPAFFVSGVNTKEELESARHLLNSRVLYYKYSDSGN